MWPSSFSTRSSATAARLRASGQRISEITSCPTGPRPCHPQRPAARPARDYQAAFVEVECGSRRSRHACAPQSKPTSFTLSRRPSVPTAAPRTWPASRLVPLPAGMSAGGPPGRDPYHSPSGAYRARAAGGVHASSRPAPEHRVHVAALAVFVRRLTPSTPRTAPSPSPLAALFPPLIYLPLSCSLPCVPAPSGKLHSV